MAGSVEAKLKTTVIPFNTCCLESLMLATWLLLAARLLSKPTITIPVRLCNSGLSVLIKHLLVIGLVIYWSSKKNASSEPVHVNTTLKLMPVHFHLFYHISFTHLSLFCLLHQWVLLILQAFPPFFFPCVSLLPGDRDSGDHCCCKLSLNFPSGSTE